MQLDVAGAVGAQLDHLHAGRGQAPRDGGAEVIVEGEEQVDVVEVFLARERETLRWTPGADNSVTYDFVTVFSGPVSLMK